MIRATFSAFRQVLLDLGFQDRSVPGSHVLLEHQGTDTVVLLRPYRDDEFIEPAILVGFRRILDEKGVVGREHFEELLRQQSLAI